MLKGQDIVLLLKFLASRSHLNWPQHQLATHLCLSPSAVNASLTHLKESGLLLIGINDQRYQLVIPACEELLIHALKYFFPTKLGNYTSGIATSYAAPIFKGQIAIGKDSIPVWPSAEGANRGLGLLPLYHCVPASLIRYPDQTFYDLLALVDAVRSGRARERSMAIQLLKEHLEKNCSDANFLNGSTAIGVDYD